MISLPCALLVLVASAQPVPYYVQHPPPLVGFAPPDPHPRNVHPKFIRHNEFKHGHWELHFEPAK